MTQKEPPKKTGKKTEPACGHCGGNEFATKQLRMAPGEFDLRNPTQWLGTVMTAYVCVKCGHVEWFADLAR